MRMIIAIMWIMLCFLIKPVFAVETLNTVYIDGVAPITIDGDLADWKGLNLQINPILNPIITPKYLSSFSNSDLSASFSSFADKNNVYVGIEVTDDKICIGNHEFGMGWNDDAIEVNFDGDLVNTSKPSFDSNDGFIRVTADKQGVTLIEGAWGKIPPYIWEARGVRAGFKKTTDGYTVEVAMPIWILELSAISHGKSMGINIRIFDNDDDQGSTNHGLSWANDPKNTSYWKTESYNQVTFAKTVPASASYSAHDGNATVLVNNQRELELGLGEPDQANYNDLIKSVFKNISDEAWETAELNLNSVKDKIWAQPLLSMIMFQEKKYKDNMNSLLTLIINSPDGRIKSWAMLEFTNNFKDIYNEVLTNMNYQEGIQIFQDFIPYLQNNASEIDIKLLLAHLYYYNNSFEQAKSICKKVLNSTTDDTKILTANMILFSINRRETILSGRK